MSKTTVPPTPFHKLWQSHLVEQTADGEALLCIDCHLVYEVTSAQTFEGLRIAGRRPLCRRAGRRRPGHRVMEPFTTLAAVVVPLDRANVDTDAIIPKQFMKSILRTGFGANLFDEWRYLDRGEPGQDPSRRQRNPDFALNQPAFAGAQILLARENFGCGSSREHAAWALHDYGIRALVAPSFADLFFGNCFKNGMLPIVLDSATVDRLFARVAARPGNRWAIDLAAQTLTPAGEAPIAFDIDPERKHRLLNGLDPIGLTLAKADAIRAYEARRRTLEPWLFA